MYEKYAADPIVQLVTETRDTCILLVANVISHKRQRERRQQDDGSLMRVCMLMILNCRNAFCWETQECRRENEAGQGNRKVFHVFIADMNPSVGRSGS